MRDLNMRAGRTKNFRKKNSWPPAAGRVWASPGLRAACSLSLRLRLTSRRAGCAADEPDERIRAEQPRGIVYIIYCSASTILFSTASKQSALLPHSSSPTLSCQTWLDLCRCPAAPAGARPFSAPWRQHSAWPWALVSALASSCLPLLPFAAASASPPSRAPGGFKPDRTPVRVSAMRSAVP